MAALSSLAEVLERYEPVIGLEVHAQLKTRSKIFSRASAAFDPEHPNRNIEPYSIGMPGVLPVLNRKVVEMAIRAGLALGCRINTTSVFARKHYFYPDLPKGYQISQYDLPICEHGRLELQPKRSIGIVRIHMEEDAGKSMHLEGAPVSLVDYNRAGVPLIEIVSAPDLKSAHEASSYLKALRAILVTLDVCDGNMEEGSFRCDANVSIRPRGATKLGTRCEIKNLNSFRYVEQAIEFEIVRHAHVLSEGGEIEQETRLFDHHKKVTRPLRSKEEAHDYRYFPDPDLPPLSIEQSWIDQLRATLPELPAQQIARYVALGVPEEHARSFAEEPRVASFFERALSSFPEGALPIANFVKGEVLRELNESGGSIESRPDLSPSDLAELVRLKEADKISSTQQKKLFAQMWREGTPLAKLLSAEGEQIGDSAVLEPIVDRVIAENPAEVERYKKGNAKLLAFFVGQVMKATRGKAKPPLVQELLERKLR
jgi:aspartyl-tRNA(Asn)/glutamyl-tRNA(Gln) amidotransferase subunit B